MPRKEYRAKTDIVGWKGGMQCQCEENFSDYPFNSIIPQYIAVCLKSPKLQVSCCNPHPAIKQSANSANATYGHSSQNVDLWCPWPWVALSL